MIIIRYIHTFLFCVNRRIKYYCFVESRIDIHIQFSVIRYTYVVKQFFFSSFNFLKISFTFTYFLFIFLIFCRLLLDSNLYKPHAYDAKCCFRPFWMVVDAAFALLLFQFICLMMFRLYFFSSFCQTYFKRISPLPLHTYFVRPRTCSFSLSIYLSLSVFISTIAQSKHCLNFHCNNYVSVKNVWLLVQFIFLPNRLKYCSRLLLKLLLLFSLYFLFSCSVMKSKYKTACKINVKYLRFCSNLWSFHFYLLFTFQFLMMLQILLIFFCFLFSVVLTLHTI